MAYKTPRVSDGGLCDDRSPQSWIPLDSPAWFAWLAAPDNVCFTYALLSHRLGDHAEVLVITGASYRAQAQLRA